MIWPFLQALLFIIVILVCWKTYISNRSTRNRMIRPDRSRYSRLELSYPNDPPGSPFDPYRDCTYDAEKLKESGKNQSVCLHISNWCSYYFLASEATLVDPYLINRPLEESMLFKDEHFPQIPVPHRFHDQKSVKRLTGLGLGLHVDFDAQDFAHIRGSMRSEKSDPSAKLAENTICEYLFRFYISVQNLTALRSEIGHSTTTLSKTQSQHIGQRENRQGLSCFFSSLLPFCFLLFNLMQEFYGLSKMVIRIPKSVGTTDTDERAVRLTGPLRWLICHGLASTSVFPWC